MDFTVSKEELELVESAYRLMGFKRKKETQKIVSFKKGKRKSGEKDSPDKGKLIQLLQPSSK